MKFLLSCSWQCIIINIINYFAVNSDIFSILKKIRADPFGSALDKIYQLEITSQLLRLFLPSFSYSRPSKRLRGCQTLSDRYRQG